MAKQLKSLQAFYKKHVPDKDPDDVADIVMKAKRRSGDSYYAEMCEKLEEKYGESPALYLESVSADANEEEPPQAKKAKESSKSEKKKQKKSDKKTSSSGDGDGDGDGHGGDDGKTPVEKLKARAAKSGKVHHRSTAR